MDRPIHPGFGDSCDPGMRGDRPAAAAGGAGRLLHLTPPDDAQWTGLRTLAAAEAMVLTGVARHDIFLLAGELHEHGRVHVAGDFLSRGAPLAVMAGSEGATLFVYRDERAPASGNETVAGRDLVWSVGAVPGISVATLSRTDHQLALVSWRAGTRAGTHMHPNGEEIFVLSGELRDERGRYAAGSWLRLPPGSVHAPFADQDTVILLRNGHLAERTVRLPSTHPAQRPSGAGTHLTRT